MTTVKDLFAMSNEALVAEWRNAKLVEIEARIARRIRDAQSDAEREAFISSRALEENKLMAEIIRLVISFRLMGREVSKPPEADE